MYARFEAQQCTAFTLTNLRVLKFRKIKDKFITLCLIKYLIALQYVCMRACMYVRDDELIVIDCRIDLGQARFMVLPWFIFFLVLCATRPKLPLGQMSNHATYHDYSLKAVGD